MPLQVVEILFQVVAYAGLELFVGHEKSSVLGVGVTAASSGKQQRLFLAGCCAGMWQARMGFLQEGVDVYYAAGIETVEKAVAAHIAGELPRFSPNHSCGGGHH